MTPAYIPLSKPTSSRTLQLVDDDRPFHGWRLPATKSWPGRVSVCPSVCDGSDLVVARSRVYITCCERHIFDVEQPRMYSPPSQVSYPESFGSLLIAYRTTLSFSLSLSLSFSFARQICSYHHQLTRRQSNPWFRSTLCTFCSTVRHAENFWKCTHSAFNLSSFAFLHKYHKLILAAKKDYYTNLVSSSSKTPKRLWQTENKLLNHKSSSLLPSSTPDRSLADRFASF